MTVTHLELRSLVGVVPLDAIEKLQVGSPVESLLPAYLDAHSWLLQTPGLWKLGDWPELTGRSAAARFLVQYALADELFPEDGMRQAHRLLESLHAGSDRYTGSLWPGGHVFTAPMQNEALDFLSQALAFRPLHNTLQGPT